MVTSLSYLYPVCPACSPFPPSRSRSTPSSHNFLIDLLYSVSSSFAYMQRVWFVPTKWPGNDLLSWLFINCFFPPHPTPFPGNRSILLFYFSVVWSTGLEHKLIDEHGNIDLDIPSNVSIYFDSNGRDIVFEIIQIIWLWIPETGCLSN